MYIIVVVMPNKLKLGRHRKYHYKQRKRCSLVVEHGPVTQTEEAPSLVLSIPLKVAEAPSLKVMQRWVKQLSLLPPGEYL